MRILFFSHYYPPEVNAPASRTSEHCRAWVQMGHEVTVVTCVPNHPTGTIYPGHKNKLFQSEMIDGVRVIRLWTFLAANEGFLRRTTNYLAYLVAALVAMPGLQRPDVVVSTSPQFFCGLAGLFARTIKRAPWVLEIRDLWPESIVTVGAMNKGFTIRMLERVERLAYRAADHIVVVTDSFVPHITANGGRADRIDIIKNGVDLSLFQRDGEGAQRLRRELGLEGKFVAAYVGTHGMAHGLDVILTAADQLRERSDIAFLLVGDGAERPALERMRAERGLDNVKIIGQRPKQDMPAIWTMTDASIIHLRRNDMFKKVLPSKMFEAMGMACPIILGVEGEARELLEASGAGLAITPEDAGALAAAVTRLADDRALAATLGQSGLTFVRAHFDRAALAARYLDLLTATAGHGRSRAPSAAPASKPLAS